MLEDVNRLHIELDYGEVVNFNNRYFTLSATEENFKKHNKLLIGSYITLSVNLLKYHGENLKTSEEFLKFPIIKKPKKLDDFFLLIWTLPTFWAKRILILRLVFYILGFHISRFPGSRFSNFQKSGLGQA